ncbi:SDR family oxidoreductase [Sphingomonas immobilis]|uniref:SDR family oxidoreductase n=1 Tax=Sphingomonas immobilis TaxID=3063997 RepID=A0ABT9A1W3_9SPHN|nr:SDR family oxidoreductase [Sphingomonas sp. CA1-15]MDO7843245.1 SDR family oxidoreductase [Sphingomonas sp. CA1-15]
MRVFVTGATGFIGTAVVKELIDAGHQVLGLTRSEQGAVALTAAGAEPHRGSLEDLDSLASGAAASDGVIHLAFNHDFTNWQAHSEHDRTVIATLGAALAGSDRLLIVTSGTAAAITPGRPTTEQDAPNSPIPRVATEEAADAVTSKGGRVVVMRLPQVHDPLKQGLITPLIEIARAKGVSAYVGDGANRWPAGHVDDVARLYRLALEKNVAGVRYNAVAEEGVALREIAEVIGRGLNIPVVSKTPEEAAEHFGWLGALAGVDIPATSALTREQLGWTPIGPTMIADLSKLAFV